MKEREEKAWIHILVFFLFLSWTFWDSTQYNSRAQFKVYATTVYLSTFFASYTIINEKSAPPEFSTSTFLIERFLDSYNLGIAEIRNVLQRQLLSPPFSNTQTLLRNKQIKNFR